MSYVDLRGRIQCGFFDAQLSFVLRPGGRLWNRAEHEQDADAARFCVSRTLLPWQVPLALLKRATDNCTKLIESGLRYM